MGMASSKMYVPGNEQEAKDYFSKDNNDRKDTNIICIGFSILKQDPKSLIQNGDPILCSNCKVGFNCYSESVAKNPDNNARFWMCEFCGQGNKLEIDENEIPKKEDCLYLLEPPQQKQGDLNDNLNIILCIDFSGSMSVTKEVKGKLDFKHSSVENIEDFKAFMEPWEFLQLKRDLENETNKKTFITRRQCVLAAIESQLNEMKTDTPNRKVGLVAFNNEVTVIGDGSKDAKVIAGDKLLNYDALLKEGLISTDTHLGTPISQSALKLFESLDRLKESGQTALGPAVLVALGMASKGSQGSKLIICTDGLANVGLGSLDNEENNGFYERLKEFAIQSGVTINVITIKGEECKLDVLGMLADNTNGKILRVDPENLNQDFANVIKGEILATKVELKVFLHKALNFRNENEGEYMNNGTIYRKLVGNVTEKSEVSFEYDLKDPKKVKEFGIDLKSLKKLPFQAQVTYTTHQGKFLRIMSKFQEISNKLEEVEREASIPVIANRAIKKSVKETLSNKNYKKAAFDSSEYYKLSEKIACNQQDSKALEEVSQLKRKTETMNKTIESLEQIESSKSLANMSPLKQHKPHNLANIAEEEEKNEFTSTIAQKPMMGGANMKEYEKIEMPEQNADCLALQLFQMKNEEQFEYDVQKPQKK